jgi:hypothetical protein
MLLDMRKLKHWDFDKDATTCSRTASTTSTGSN